jgi:hypothetical protein
MVKKTELIIVICSDVLRTLGVLLRVPCIFKYQFALSSIIRESS